MSSSANNNQSIADRVLSAIEEVLFSARLQGYKVDDKFVRRYTKYVKEISSAYSKNGKARAIAKHIIPNEDVYNKKITEYPDWYENNDKGNLLTNLLKFLELCREISLAPTPKKPKEEITPTKEEVRDWMDEIFGRKKN